MTNSIIERLEKLRDRYCDNKGAIDVINNLQVKENVFLTGKAGTGKSYLINQICDVLGDSVIKLAPTGLTAINIKGQTLHSFFKIPLRPILPNDQELEKLTGNRVQAIKKCNLIVIDEISMVRADVLSAIDQILRLTLRRTDPFGGKQFLVVGDLYQLPPILHGDEREFFQENYSSEFFFGAPGLSNEFIKVQLEKVYRQSDPVFIKILDLVRVAKLNQDQIDWINRKAVKKQQENCITIASTNRIAANINANKLVKINNEVHTFDAHLTGTFVNSASLPAELELDLKVGAQVMMCNNDRTEEGLSRWQNGTIAKVIDISDDTIYVLIGNVKEEVERHTWTDYEYVYDKEAEEITQQVIGTFTQYPMKLAWAVTIHKSQGQTFDNVNIDLGRGAFSAGQTYVAMSRCRTFEGISLKQPLKPSDMFTNTAVDNFLQGGD